MKQQSIIPFCSHLKKATYIPTRVRVARDATWVMRDGCCDVRKRTIIYQTTWHQFLTCIL